MFRSIAILILCLATTTTTHAALLGRAALTPGGTDYQAYYDTDLDITWLADASYGWTNNFGVATVSGFGTMDWNTAQTWLAAMNAENFLGASNWRMPSTTVPDASCEYQVDAGGSYPLQPVGNFCTGSELTYMFNVEGVRGGSLYSSPFTNLFQGRYWSGTDYAPDQAQAFWVNSFAGYQGLEFKYQHHFVWAVRSGDISVVPIPAAAWLFGSALGVMGWMRRKAAPHSALLLLCKATT